MMASGPNGSWFIVSASCGNSAITVRLHRALASRIRERRHLRILVEAVADLEGFGAGHEFLDETREYRLVHQEPRRRHADLARVAILHERHRFRRGIDVRIVED